MLRVFYIVGPTGCGKSELAADVALRMGGEVVSADAFQIYTGFDTLSGKPGSATLGKVHHHLIGTVPATEEMNAAKYRDLSVQAIRQINTRGKSALIVGGSGLYVKSLTDGLMELPSANTELRAELNEVSTDELCGILNKLDPHAAEQIDVKNRRRLIRAVEVCLVTAAPVSAQRTQWRFGRHRGDRRSGPPEWFGGRSYGSRRRSGDRHSLDPPGVFVFRDRDELYGRINDRVEAMLGNGAIEEVRQAGELSRTVQQMIGIGQICKHLSGEISLGECCTRIQQLTRRYAKRQLTWFRHQTKFVTLNLSLLTHNEAVEWVTRRALAAVRVND